MHARMNALEFLKQDHETVKELFHAFRKPAASTARRQQIAEKLFDQLAVHTRIEEEIFYPTVQDFSDNKSVDLVHKATQEHWAAKMLIGELRAMSVASAGYDAKINELRESVEHHVQEEEGALFSWAKKKLDALALDELGTRMAKRKHALTRPSFIGATLTRAKDMVSGALSAAAETLGVAPAAPSRSPTHRHRKTVAVAKKHVAKSAGRAKTQLEAKPVGQPKSRTAHTHAARKKAR